MDCRDFQWDKDLNSSIQVSQIGPVTSTVCSFNIIIRTGGVDPREGYFPDVSIFGAGVRVADDYIVRNVRVRRMWLSMGRDTQFVAAVPKQRWLTNFDPTGVSRLSYREIDTS